MTFAQPVNPRRDLEPESEGLAQSEYRDIDMKVEICEEHNPRWDRYVLCASRGYFFSRVEVAGGYFDEFRFRAVIFDYGR